MGGPRTKKRKLPSAAQVAKLVDEVKSNPREKANNVPILISHLSSNSVQALPAIHALREFFIGCFQREEMGSSAVLDQQQQDPTSPASVFAAWLQRQHTACIQALLNLMTSNTGPRVQVAALSALMELVRGRKAGIFDNDMFSKIVAVALTQSGVSAEVLGAIIDKYAQHADVRYHLLRTIHKICDRRAARPAAKTIKQSRKNKQAADNNSEEDEAEEENGGDQETKGVSQELPPHDIARNILDVLLRIPSPEAEEAADGGQLTSWCGAAELGAVAPAADADGSRQRKKNKRAADTDDLLAQLIGIDKSPPLMVAKWASVKLRRRAYSDAWISFLRLDLPDDTYRKALSRLHDLVVPNLFNPLLLSDFLTHSLNKGGMVGMLALNGIFILVTRHGLEYPKFYERLYGMVTPDAFLSKHRRRFFQLADIFLASALVPAYTCAAFAKRFARLALSSPPAGALVSIAFVHNILRRHPACMQLLHRSLPGGLASTVSSAVPAPGAAPVWHGHDVYDSEEQDPSKSRALESSLWELTALQRHSDPSVASYCSILEKDLGDRRKTAEVDVAEVLEMSYGSEFTREVGRRLKQVPAAFYAEPPQSLLGGGGGDLVGWKA